MSGSTSSALPRGLLDDIARSALLGIATGGRTMTPIAALAATASPVDTDAFNRNLGRTPVRVALGLAALGELVGDKLPQTPSRLSAAGLPARLVFGGLCGAAVGARRPAAPVALLDESAVDDRVGEADPHVRTAVCVATGVVTALAGSLLGVRWRALATQRTRLGKNRRRKQMFAAAVAEDAAVVGLASAGARR